MMVDFSGTSVYPGPNSKICCPALGDESASGTPTTGDRSEASPKPDTHAPRSQQHPAHGRSDSGTQISASCSLLLPLLTLGGSLGTINKFPNQTIVDNMNA
ncbi:hypothetical protein CHARACLAT_019779 [Characodon lateralis]|uniref:Uncharacterized protein n=1 Tax=Characodon lateralis TaxID=208331 RepID=A0ABU7CQC0_9TELE|nr:hypothetical protein [Characodon lateralis]